MAPITDLLTALDEAFDKNAWHGPNLRGTLRGVDARQAGWRPAPGRHNIWELAVHAAYWKYAVRRRVSGAKRGSFAVAGSNWFERPQEIGDAAWKADVDLLVREHRALRATIEALLAADLRGEAGAAKLRMIRGVAAHDLYHAGQIQLLKRLYPG
ncbi:MAG: DinB family protein [Bryobacteraceae bacterium]